MPENFAYHGLFNQYKKERYVVAVFQKTNGNFVEGVQEATDTQWVYFTTTKESAEKKAKELATRWPQYCVHIGKMYQKYEYTKPEPFTVTNY